MRRNFSPHFSSSSSSSFFFSSPEVKLPILTYTCLCQPNASASNHESLKSAKSRDANGSSFFAVDFVSNFQFSSFLIPISFFYNIRSPAVLPLPISSLTNFGKKFINGFYCSQSANPIDELPLLEGKRKKRKKKERKRKETEMCNQPTNHIPPSIRMDSQEVLQQVCKNANAIPNSSLKREATKAVAPHSALYFLPSNCIFHFWRHRQKGIAFLHPFLADADIMPMPTMSYYLILFIVFSMSNKSAATKDAHKGVPAGQIRKQKAKTTADSSCLYCILFGFLSTGVTLCYCTVLAIVCISLLAFDMKNCFPFRHENNGKCNGTISRYLLLYLSTLYYTHCKLYLFWQENRFLFRHENNRKNLTKV